MKAKLIDGKLLAAEVKAEVAQEVSELKQRGASPKLVVFLVGEDPASTVYVRGKEKDCIECGIDSQVVRLPADTSQQALLAHVGAANADPAIHGILVQLPLPPGIEERAVIEAIDPAKDVDGFHPINVGRLHIGQDCLAPCTPSGCMVMLQRAGVDPTGKQAVVVGRSNIVGKPIAAMLVAANATVTVCHTRTKDMAAELARADIVVAAAGREGLVRGEMLKPGCVVIDVGVNRGEDGKLHGDVDFASAGEVASAITPVPGGVGLMTRAMLLKNTVKACRQQVGL